MGPLLVLALIITLFLAPYIGEAVDKIISKFKKYLGEMKK